MGLACVKPRVNVWDEPPLDKQEIWTAGVGSVSPSKCVNGRPVSEPNSPGLIRAHHADIGAEGTPVDKEACARAATGQAAESAQPCKAPISWSCGECIGQGAFGKVFLGLNTASGELMAVKQIRISSEQAVAAPVAVHVRKVEAEVNVLKQLHHANIVRYLGTERTDEHLNIFLEYVPGGSIASLLSKFGRFNESIIKIYTRQILMGLEYLHSHGIMHRDIKGANILVDNTGLVKLADFGASKKIESLATIDSGVKQSIKGTPHWMAPEVIHQTGVGRAADIWSVGCTVIEMATGKPPWAHITSQVSVMLHIAQTNGPPPLPDSLSDACRDFLRLCFNRSPRDRPNATRLLQHPFLDGVVTRNVTASPLTNISQVPVLPKGMTQMEVPSPIQEESGTTATATPTSRGTGTTSSSSNRRPDAEDDLLSRFSPMGAAVRQSQLLGLTPVVEGSLEGQGSAENVSASVGDSNAFEAPLRGQLVGSPRLRSSIDDFNPVVEPTWNAERSPWAAAEGRGHAYRAPDKGSWPRTSLAGSENNHPQSAADGLQVGGGADVQPMMEANEESIMMWVQDRAQTETLRLSQSFHSLSLRQAVTRSPQPRQQASPAWTIGSPAARLSPPQSPPGVVDAHKRAKWEAELQQELAQQRHEQRLTKPVARRL